MDSYQDNQKMFKTQRTKSGVPLLDADGKIMDHQSKTDKIVNRYFHYVAGTQLQPSKSYRIE